jgi:cell filamentation protein
MNQVVWRWEERDFGFRFRDGKGPRSQEYYQAAKNSTYYIIPKSQRKFSKKHADALSVTGTIPNSINIVPSPWQNYDRDWNWIVTEDNICLNYAGCLEKEEINRREDEGVARAMEFVTRILDHPEHAPLTIELLRQVHLELMGDIYPFAGEWRTVALHKGGGPIKWPLPLGGFAPVIDELERNVFSRSPIVSNNDDEVFSYASEVMNEIIAIHPFREGNGRTAFVVGNLILMQNDLMPIDVYDRRRDETRYFTACEAGRISGNYMPLADLISEWENEAIARWEVLHGQI